MARIVVALGGNALGSTPYEQREKVAKAAEVIADFIEQGNEVIITHGNGPQVGMINLGLNHSASDGVIKAEMPFPECGAMSQGYIGYHLQNAILKVLTNRGIRKNVLTVVTQVVVDSEDPGFKTPTKPIGAFYTKNEAIEQMKKDPSSTFKEDAGRGWRKVVASPVPVDVVEKGSIVNLIECGNVVIACGGGGIPVIKKDEGDFEGVPAVIDKDFASECIAEIVDADALYILTAVDNVCLNFNRPDQKELAELKCEEAEKYIKEGQFAPGSMLPKVKAAVKFAKSKKDRTSVICSLDKAPLAMSGKSGTRITI